MNTMQAMKGLPTNTGVCCMMVFSLHSLQEIFRSVAHSICKALGPHNKVPEIKVTLQASRAYLIAAATAAPEEMPHNRPSSRAKRRAMTTLSFDEMAMTSSIISRFRTFGMNPAPMPWICIAATSMTIA